MTIFTHVAQGVALWHCYEAATVAAANAYLRPTTAEALVTDAQAVAVLPLFGHRLQTARVRDSSAASGTREARYWQLTYPFNTFWQRLRSGLRAVLTRTAHPDGTLTEHLTATAAQTVWEQARASAWTANDRMLAVSGTERTAPRPEDAHAPLHVATALAAFGGILWTVSANGTAAERLLPAQPLRHVPPGGAQPRLGELKNKLLFPCVGWAYLPAHTTLNEASEHALVYLSAVGPHKKLKAVWAALMDTKRDLLALPSTERGQQLVRARRPEGKGVFDVFWNEEPLPASGLAHLVIQHRSMLHPRPGQPFLHLTGDDGLPNLALVARQLDAASTYPIQPHWVGKLWDAGVEHQLITALPSYGCAAYWVNVHDEAAWGDSIARCAGATTATVETYGADASDGPQVAEVISEADEERST